MSICKHYVKGNCTNGDNCRFKHIDNICRNYFFNHCNNDKCKFLHTYKLHNNKNRRQKNTESFTPDNSEPKMRVLFNKPIINGNEICIINNIIWPNDPINVLQNEINNYVFKPWHGDSHLIADDSLDWKKHSPSFNTIINILCDYFKMTASATRLNLYENGEDWKPYHHDAAALKPEKAKTQNITVGVSFGLTRSISFQDVKSYHRIDFPLENGFVYAFGNQINIDYKHGIPQYNGTSNEKRISIIIWGYSNYL